MFSSYVLENTYMANYRLLVMTLNAIGMQNCSTVSRYNASRVQIIHK